MNRRSFLGGMAGLASGSQLSRLHALATENAASTSLGFRFTDVTSEAGIHFQHNSGAFGGKFLPETLGSGCAFLDYDRDGWQDILLINGADWPGHKKSRTTLHLCHNNGNGTFTDVTSRAGLDVEMYGMGVAVGDYNNDGFPDILVTCVGQTRLFRNTGRGTFVDVTNSAGLGKREGFSTSALWFDYDRDGLLDLFVCNYVKWSLETDIFCTCWPHAGPWRPRSASTWDRVPRHCLRARRNILIRDVMLMVIVLAGLIIRTLPTLDFLLFTISLGMLLPNAGRKRSGLIGTVLFSLVALAGVALSIAFMAFLALGSFASSLATGGSLASGAAGFFGAVFTFLFLLAATWATEFGYLRTTFRTLAEGLRRGSGSPRALSGAA